MKNFIQSTLFGAIEAIFIKKLENVKDYSSTHHDELLALEKRHAEIKERVQRHVKYACVVPIAFLRHTLASFKFAFFDYDSEGKVSYDWHTLWKNYREHFMDNNKHIPAYRKWKRFWIAVFTFSCTLLFVLLVFPILSFLNIELLISLTLWVLIIASSLRVIDLRGSFLDSLEKKRRTRLRNKLVANYFNERLRENTFSSLHKLWPYGYVEDSLPYKVKVPSPDIPEELKSLLPLLYDPDILLEEQKHVFLIDDKDIQVTGESLFNDKAEVPTLDTARAIENRAFGIRDGDFVVMLYSSAFDSDSVHYTRNTAYVYDILEYLEKCSMEN